jgi:hypothetical protein
MTTLSTTKGFYVSLLCCPQSESYHSPQQEGSDGSENKVTTHALHGWF